MVKVVRVEVLYNRRCAELRDSADRQFFLAGVSGGSLGDFQGLIISAKRLIEAGILEAES